MKVVFNLLGVDRAVAYTLLSRSWTMLSGLITLWFISKYLTPSEQGFYYTFASILALQVTFELGMSYVIMQFASHEMAYLHWSSINTLAGEEKALSRVSSLLALVAKWYGVISILIVVTVLPLGWLFFTSNGHEINVSWQLPWVWLIITASINIFIVPLFALLEGCGKVAEVAIVRMYQGIIGSLIAWLVFTSNGGLLAMPAMNTVVAIIGITWLYFKYQLFFKSLQSNHTSSAAICWKTEIWPFQSKVALSWLSGYFIFQLFVPVLFAYRGSVEAGQMGMGLNIAAALASISIAWVNTKTPIFGQLIALKRFHELDRLFFRVLFQSTLVISLGALSIMLSYCWLAANYPDISNRILSFLPLLLLILTTIINHIVASEAIYLRAHKSDPFMPISITTGVLMFIIVVMVGKEYGATGMMLGYFVVSLIVSLGIGSYIFISKRSKWHHAVI